MTIATDRAQEFTVDQLVARAYRRAGLLNEAQSASAPKLATGREEMQLLLQRLEARGVFARTTVFQYVACVAGTQSYALDTAVVAVLGAQYIPASETNYERPSVESPLTLMAMEEWAELTPKDQSGEPTRYWVDRAAQVVWLDTVPDEAGHLRLRVQRLRASSLDGNATPDVERFWADYLCWALAHVLAVANSRNLSACAYLERQAEQAKTEAEDAARPREDIQFYVGR